MNQKQKKIENTVKIRSYMEIKKREVFGNQKIGAKLLKLKGKVSSIFLKLSFRKRLAVGVITAIIAIGGVFVYFQTRVGATTYQWLQASWIGNADTVNFPRHGQDTPGVPKQNWDKFYSKDTTQVKTDSGDVELNSTSSNWPDNFSGGAPDSNTYVSGGLVNLKKNNGVTCSADQQCTADNCDADFSSGNYCHATVSSCVNYALGTPWERATGYALCSGSSYYKLCTNSVWGAQQNSPDTANDYCDAGGGAQSGYDLLATCASGIGGGFTDPSCYACPNYYMAASTSSCKTSCTVDGNCWSGYICSGSACINPWISGYCGIQVYYIDVSGTKSWKTSITSCDTPQCGQDGGQDGDNLVASNSVDFSLYTARNECKNLGGRLATITELQCVYTNRANLGSFQSSYYWSATEYDSGNARTINFGSGAMGIYNKTWSEYVRCVK